ncbi:hypothetical protein DFH28DRAFT_1195524 [Melampsora americana]|nr:hypothetical protein DFH28DRAFT_1195524 [Melampsora americana]
MDPHRPNQHHMDFNPQSNRFPDPLDHMNQGFPDQQFGPLTQGTQNRQLHFDSNQIDRSHYDLTHYGPNSQQSRGFTGFDSGFDSPLFNQTQYGSNHTPHILQPQPQGSISTLARLEEEIQSNSAQPSAYSASNTTQVAQSLSKSKKKGGTKKSTVHENQVESTRNILDGFLSREVFSEINMKPGDPSAEELMAQKSLGQLRFSAEEVGKTSLSEDDEVHFLNFDDNIKKSLAINCLGRGVKLSAVEAFLGRKKPFRDLTRWHGYLQAQDNRQVYRDHKGVSDGKATSQLKRKYRELTEEEKDAYKPKNKLQRIWEEFENNVGNSNDIDCSINGENSGENLKNGEGSVSTVRSKSRSFATDQDKVVKWLREANIQLRRLCATYHLEGVIMVVSTHVSYGSVQLFRGTEGAVKWHDTTKELKPQDDCLANFHAFVLGRRVGLVLEDKNIKPKSDKSQAKERLGNLLSEFTKEKYKQWPWKNCNSTLERWGYKVSILPNAVSKLDWITSLKGSNALTSQQARLILIDLNGDMIQLSHLDLQAGNQASLDPQLTNHAESSDVPGPSSDVPGPQDVNENSNGLVIESSNDI